MKYKTAIFWVMCIVALVIGVMAYNRMMFKQFVHNHYGDGDQAGLVYAALTGDEKGLEKYLAQGVPIDFYDQQKRFTPLDIAIGKRNRKAVLMLLKHGANPNFGGTNGVGEIAIFVAVDHNDTWFLETLLKNGVDPNSQMDNAVMFHSLPAVKILIEAGADVNGKAGEQPPVICGSQGGSYDIVYYLLEKGADPKAEGTLHETMLDWVTNDVNQISTPDKEKVIEWLKARNLWKDKSELWKERQAAKASEEKQRATP